jgi:alpha-galactosidase
MSPILPLVVLAATVPAAEPAAEPAFHAWAPSPPMGWNSWDCFGTTVTEAQVRAQADFMAAKLKAHGWQYIVVDIQWYEPHAQSHSYRKDAVLTLDGYGRLLPAPNKFPSSSNGSGFKPLADYIHGLGLKFGVHLMRGIPRQAVEANLPVLGTTFHAQDIADRADVCPWNPDMYGVDVSKPGGQAYYDSVFGLFASWGIDFVKVDDMSRPYLQHQGEVEAVRRAIDATGRPIVLSLSPGETAIEASDHAAAHANMWRISDDFWDRWLPLKQQFARLALWNPHRQPGAWPDADMLPLGVLNLGERPTRLTPDEQRTMMTLWSIARSPLMHGGDLTRTDSATLALLTNDAVLGVNQRSSNNRPLFDRDELVAWTANLSGTPDKVLAVFNARDRVRLVPGNARYVSAPVTAEPSTFASIDADLSGGTRLFLSASAVDSRGDWNRILWRDARLVLADGTEEPLAGLAWSHADSSWDSTAVKKENGKILGIGAELPSIIEYTLPAGARRLKAIGVVLDNGRGQVPGPVQFLVAVATPENENRERGVPVPVALADLGFTGEVRVTDVWDGRDLGTAAGNFEPVVPFHGAGLYRLSPGHGR